MLNSVQCGIEQMQYLFSKIIKVRITGYVATVYAGVRCDYLVQTKTIVYMHPSMPKKNAFLFHFLFRKI